MNSKYTLIIAFLFSIVLLSMLIKTNTQNNDLHQELTMTQKKIDNLKISNKHKQQGVKASTASINASLLPRLQALADQFHLDIKQFSTELNHEHTKLSFTGNFLSVLDFLDKLSLLPLNVRHIRIKGLENDHHDVDVFLALHT